jgi:transposase
MADRNLRATPAQLCDALGACVELRPIYRRLLTLFLEELQLIDQQISRLDQELANLLSRYQTAVEYLAEVPGLGVDSAQQIIAEIGAQAATFPSAKQLSSWVGACPGDDESAAVSKSHRSPKGNRQMRRILNQAANAAVKSKGTVFGLSIVDWCPASDTITPSGPLPIGFVASSGSFCMKERVTKSEAP